MDIKKLAAAAAVSLALPTAASAAPLVSINVDLCWFDAAATPLSCGTVPVDIDSAGTMAVPGGSDVGTWGWDAGTKTLVMTWDTTPYSGLLDALVYTGHLVPGGVMQGGQVEVDTGASTTPYTGWWVGSVIR